jgi:hypothetical protein
MTCLLLLTGYKKSKHLIINSCIYQSKTLHNLSIA